MMQQIKLLYKITLYYITFVLFRLINHKPKLDLVKRLLVIKADGFGDHVLFRNFLEEIKNSNQYNNYELHFVGSQAWREFALEFDSDFVDTFIWVDRNKFKKSFIYRLSVLRELNNHWYDVILYANFVRETIIGDCLTACLYADKKIANVGAIEYRYKIENMLTNLAYDNILPRLSAHGFEFEQNKYCIEQFITTKLDTKQILSIDRISVIDDRYILFFVGVSDTYRKWRAENFIKLAHLLHQKYSYKIILCGDIIDQKSFALSDAEETFIINRIGSTSQIELVELINAAEFIVSNDTVVPHIAVALDKVVFTLFCSANYPRYTSYTNKNYHLILHPWIVEHEESYIEMSNKLAFRSKLDINLITVNDVYSKIKQEIK